MQHNKSILITGSGKGLGKELSLVFSENGYEVIVHDLTELDLQEIKSELSSKGANFSSVAGDLKSETTLNNLCEIAKEKKIAGLINNAGIHCPKLPLDELSENQIKDMLSVNFIAPIMLIHKLYPFFMHSGGTIVNINSISGLENQKLRTIYCSSKWGLRGFSDTLKMEAGEKNVRIIDVYPSRIKTKPEFTEGMETRGVAQKIYQAFQDSETKELILDDRPKK